MTAEEFIKLYEKYIAGFCSAEEEKQLLHHKDSFKISDESLDESAYALEGDKEIKNRVYQQILQSLSEQQTSTSKPVTMVTAAAVVFLSLSIGLVLFYQKTSSFAEANQVALSDPIQPGADKAILTLADGSTIQLNEAKAGVLSTAGKTLIKKSASEIFWSPRKSLDWSDFITRLEHRFKYLEITGTNYAKSMYDPIISGVKENNEIKAKLASEIPGLEIRYTFDGSNPTRFSSRFGRELLTFPKGATELRVRSFSGSEPVGIQIKIPLHEISKRVR